MVVLDHPFQKKKVLAITLRNKEEKQCWLQRK